MNPEFEPIVPTSQHLRINTLKTIEESVVKRLKQAEITLEKTPLPGCYVFSASFALSSTTQHLLGHFYLQGLASQVVAHVLNPKEDMVVIDMAAAPGSKTTHIAQLMHNTGRILALDRNSDRLNAVRDNCERLGVTNVVSLRKDARFVTDLKIQADAILLDAPCSGNYCSEESWEEKRTIQDIKANARVQKELIKAATIVLKPGGTLVYSTCSLEPEEDELIINWALEHLDLELVEISLPDLGQLPGITEWDGEKLHASLNQTLRFWPYKTGTEGFFVAKMKKPLEKTTE